MKIAVASGKGGTGKTLVSTSLAWILSSEGHQVVYVDADVEEPNGHLFLKPDVASHSTCTVDVPKVVDSRCTGCGVCQQACAFNAIIALPNDVLLFPELCHSCGACVMACPEQALIEMGRPLGVVERGDVATDGSARLGFISGTLNVGEARSTPLVGCVLEEVDDEGIVVVDAPPGTSCNVMKAVSGADLVILVTEPTSFGLHDLVLAASMAKSLGLRVAAVINRADLGDEKARGYLAGQEIEVLAEIPFLREVAEAYASGRVAASVSSTLRELLVPVAGRLLEQVRESS